MRDGSVAVMRLEAYVVAICVPTNVERLIVEYAVGQSPGLP